jgi:nitrite reductase/ring-hydroxylating ferredoxin subunit
MSSDTAELDTLDFGRGVPLSRLPDGAMLSGHLGDEPVLLARRGDEVFAVGSVCTHYGAPLADGLMVGDTVRCPWHHACFSLRTGEPLRAPALNAIPCFDVEQSDGLVRVRARRRARRASRPPGQARPAGLDRDRRRRAPPARPRPKRSGAKAMPVVSRC